jgi:hypothetical protein
MNLDADILAEDAQRDRTDSEVIGRGPVTIAAELEDDGLAFVDERRGRRPQGGAGCLFIGALALPGKLVAGFKQRLAVLAFSGFVDLFLAPLAALERPDRSDFSLRLMNGYRAADVRPENLILMTYSSLVGRTGSPALLGCAGLRPSASFLSPVQPTRIRAATVNSFQVAHGLSVEGGYF